MFVQIFQDALFAAIAAIGFAAISRPPRQAYLLCAITAAVGHSIRFTLTDGSIAGLHITAATLIASAAIGLVAVALSPIAHIPAETCLFPALLPMIPGMYAYRMFGGLAYCLFKSNEADFMHYFYLFASNGATCFCILLCMVTGATLPVFMFKRISFQATRQDNNDYF